MLFLASRLDRDCIWVTIGENVNISSGFSTLFAGQNIYVLFSKFLSKVQYRSYDFFKIFYGYYILF